MRNQSKSSQNTLQANDKIDMGNLIAIINYEDMQLLMTMARDRRTYLLMMQTLCRVSVDFAASIQRKTFRWRRREGARIEL